MATATAKKEKFDIAAMIADFILESLDAGVVPWDKPWENTDGFHTNLKSKKAYRGINVWLLAYSAMQHGFASPYWLTPKQIIEYGGTIKKGSETTVVVFYKTIEKKDKSGNVTDRFRMLRYYRVLNVEQTEGLEDRIPAKVERPEFVPVEEADRIVNSWTNRPKINHRGNSAHFIPLMDLIELPRADSFKSAEAYSSTRFHELVHSTGSSERLNRDGVAALDSNNIPKYSKEELIAEMGAAILNWHSGIFDVQRDSSAAYIDAWRKKISDDKKIVVDAAREAQKAVDMIFGTFDNQEG
jgi:antirestriction protein ArdC